MRWPCGHTMVHMDFHPGKPPWLPGIHFLHACHGYTTQGPRLLVSSNASSRHRNAVALWTHYGPYGCPPRKPPWLPGIHFLYAYHGYTAQCTRLLVSSIRSHCPSPDGQCLPANMPPPSCLPFLFLPNLQRTQLAIPSSHRLPVSSKPPSQRRF
jgi:hypothetical protein